MIKPESIIITISNYGRKFSAELPCDSSIGEVCDALKGLLKAAGYADETVNDYIKSDNE